MFAEEFAAAGMTAIVENIFEDGQWAILDSLGKRGRYEKENKDYYWNSGCFCDFCCRN